VEHVGGEGHVRHPCDADRLPVVEGLDLGEFIEVAEDEIANAPNELAALGGRHRRPGSRFEGAPRRLDGTVDVLLVPFGDLANLASRGGIHYGEGLSGGCGHPAAADEKLFWSVEECQS
jgi:hypothetical protein